MYDKPYPPKCYYCEFTPATQDSYERHVVQKHVLMPGYPNAGDIEHLHIEKQGMKWEKALSDAETLEIINRYIPHDEKVKRRRVPTKKIWLD